MNEQTLQTLFSSKNDEWGTPPEIYDPLHEIYNFTLDPCGTPPDGVIIEEKFKDDEGEAYTKLVTYHTPAKCAKSYSIEDDGLAQDWGGETFFLNNPYSHMKEWTQKAFEESRKPGTRGVQLCPARTETQWMKIAWDHASNIYFYHKRIQFLKNEKVTNSATFPSVLIEWDSRVERLATDCFMFEHPNGHRVPHERYIGLVDHNLNRLS